MNTTTDIFKPVVVARSKRSKALAFVLIIGAVSFFADFTYEGSRSVLGPFLALLGASAFIVGVVTGFGELLGYGLQLLSGRMADRTRQFWPLTIIGHVVQMLSVPALALTHSWKTAAIFIVLERAGKATRNPARDTMLSHAAKEVGLGWAFGLHEAFDQFGALFGPLAVAGLLAWRGNYQFAFGVLLLPAVICLAVLALARWLHPRPEEMESAPRVDRAKGLPRVFWIYLLGAALVAAGFADFPLIAFHFQKTGSVPKDWVPLLYAIAMATSGIGSLVFGRLLDGVGAIILVPLTLISAVFAPLVFLGGFWPALIGASLWGVGMGVHESIIPAVVAPMVAPQRRASAYGLFTAGYGLFWFLGSALLGFLYDHSRMATVAACLALQLAAIPFFLVVGRLRKAS